MAARSIKSLSSGVVRRMMRADSFAMALTPRHYLNAWTPRADSRRRVALGLLVEHEWRVRNEHRPAVGDTDQQANQQEAGEDAASAATHERQGHAGDRTDADGHAQVGDRLNGQHGRHADSDEPTEGVVGT